MGPILGQDSVTNNDTFTRPNGGGLFTRLIGKDDLAGADHRRGWFRSFLLTSLKHYLANESPDRPGSSRANNFQTFHSGFMR